MTRSECSDTRKTYQPQRQTQTSHKRTFGVYMLTRPSDPFLLGNVVRFNTVACAVSEHNDKTRLTLSQRESYAPSEMRLPPPRDIVTQISPLHVGLAESVQSVDAKHVVTTAAVATMVFPVKVIVETSRQVHQLEPWIRMHECRLCTRSGP